MLALRTVAMTDGDTSLHSPLFTVGVMTTSFVVAGDEHEVANRVRPAAADATKSRVRKRGRTAAGYTRSASSDRQALLVLQHAGFAVLSQA